jgi:arylsulfatase A-like enzyme
LTSAGSSTLGGEHAQDDDVAPDGRSGEGNLRTPCIVRWPGHTRSGETSDEIMYVTDWCTTILRAAGAEPPKDRVIDGVDQLGWLTGQAPSSAREGYIFWMGQEMYGVKWRNFKLVLVDQKYSTSPPAKLASPPYSLLDSQSLQPPRRRLPRQRRTRAAHPRRGTAGPHAESNLITITARARRRAPSPRRSP